MAKPKKQKKKTKKLIKKISKLTPNRLLFIDKYFEQKFNGTEAYLQAYPQVKKRATARTAAARMLANVLVAEEVERRRIETHLASKDIINKIREEIEYLAFARMGTYLSFGPGGVVLRSSDDMTNEELAAVAEVTETITKDGGSVKFKLHPKKDSLELLMKYHGLIIERSESTGKDGGPIETTITNFPPMSESIEDWLAMCKKVDIETKKEKEKAKGE